MQQFKIAPDKLSEFKRILIRRTVAMSLIIGCFCLVGTYFLLKKNSAEDDINPLFVSIPVTVLIFGILTNKKIKKQKEVAETYTLTVNDEIISREQADLPTLSLMRNEIKKITRTKTGSLFINGSRIMEQIEIPPQIDNYAQLYDILEKIKPVKQVSYNSGLLVVTVSILAGITTFGIFAGTNKVIVAVCGTLISAMMFLLVCMALSGKYGDEKTKKKVWIYVIAAISYIAITINKLLE